MQVVSTCPKCNSSYGWDMDARESTPDGGERPARSPNCPKCGYDVTESNELAAHNFHYYAQTDDVEAMEELINTSKDEKERLIQEYEERREAHEKAQQAFRPRLSNLFGLFRPRAPEPPVLPDIPNVNAPVQGQHFNPLLVAAINGSERATHFLLNNGVDPSAIPLALEKAKQWGHPGVIKLLNAHLDESE